MRLRRLQVETTDYIFFLFFLAVRWHLWHGGVGYGVIPNGVSGDAQQGSGKLRHWRPWKECLEAGNLRWCVQRLLSSTRTLRQRKVHLWRWLRWGQLPPGSGPGASTGQNQKVLVDSTALGVPRTQKLMLSLESRAISQYTSRFRFRSVLVTASYGHYGHTADRILPDRICRIRLSASDSALFFQRKPGPYCAKSALIRSGWPGLVLAKRIWSWSKPVYNCKTHRVRFLAGRNRPATSFFHFQTRLRSSTDGPDHSYIVQNQPGSDLVWADGVRFWLNGSGPEAESVFVLFLTDAGVDASVVTSVMVGGKLFNDVVFSRSLLAATILVTSIMN